MTTENRRIYIATNNNHKLAEIRSLLNQTKSAWEVLPANAVDPNINWNETGTTFLENARIKCATLLRYFGDPRRRPAILADDSGLEVDALHGAPGVWSSGYAALDPDPRYSQKNGKPISDGDHEANNARLLRELADVAPELRTARFVCTLVLVDEFCQEHIFRGTCEGRIATTPRGQQGFGYDPLFLCNDFPERAMAELSVAEKNAISHRGKAMQKLLAFISSR